MICFIFNLLYILNFFASRLPSFVIPDSQSPTFGLSCPGSPLLAYAERDKFTALVNWTEPVAIDNSGVAPTVTSNYKSPQRFSQGAHVITYTAVDQSGNSAPCTFQVQVLGNEDFAWKISLRNALCNFYTSQILSVNSVNFYVIILQKTVLFIGLMQQ